MRNKKAIYLGFVAIVMILFTAYLFRQKSLQLKSELVAGELQKSLLSYIEKEEVYPVDLKNIKFNNRSLEVSYEVLEDGRGCRFTVGKQVIELWDEKR